MAGAAARFAVRGPRGLGASLRAGLVSGAGALLTDQGWATSRRRGFLEATLDYGVQLAPGVRLVLGVGAQLANDRDRISSLAIGFGDCDPGAGLCNATTELRTASSSRWRAQLVGRLGLMVGDRVFFGYSLLFDPEARSVGHAITLGVSF